MSIPEEAREIENIFLDFPGYNCFVCAPNHPDGFRLKFYHVPEENAVLAPIPAAGPDRAGFPGVMHGGFQAMLLDEIMCWAALHLEKKIVFTGKLSVRLTGTLPVDAPLLARGWIEKGGARLVRAAATIEADGQVKAKAEGGLFVPTAGEFAKVLRLGRVPEKYLPYLRS
jgi:acyl-coenzyme A thioesterase PaaI-like protein